MPPFPFPGCPRSFGLSLKGSHAPFHSCLSNRTSDLLKLRPRLHAPKFPRWHPLHHPTPTNRYLILQNRLRPSLRVEHGLCPPYPYTSYGLCSAVCVITGTRTLWSRRTMKGDDAAVEPCRGDIMRDRETLCVFAFLFFFSCLSFFFSVVSYIRFVLRVTWLIKPSNSKKSGAGNIRESLLLIHP